MTQETIKKLILQGWSQRQIARELGIHRKTVRNYADEIPKCTGVLTGNQAESGSKCTTLLTGDSEKEDSKCTGVLTGISSLCEPFGKQIEKKLELGLTAIRIHRELKQEQGFEGGYDSVRRYVNRLKQVHPKRIWRMECEPGEEAQVDYGTMRILENDKGNLCKVHIFRITLSHSRKSYSEAVRSQSTDSFIRSLENAFRHFGGVAERLCLDNLKAAVSQADWYDPQITPKFASFARHYGIIVMPTRPYTPQHKGKVERGIKYVKNDALKGLRFKSLKEINEHLRDWESQVADKRIHGTTKVQVCKLFEEMEKAHLRQLPGSLFPSFTEQWRSVHRDGYVEVEGSYYFMPEEYIGHDVVVRWDQAMVRIFSRSMKKLAVYSKLEKGQSSEVLGVGGCRVSVQETILYYRRKLAQIGEYCASWADGLIAHKADLSIRVMQGLLQIKGCTYKQLNQACYHALVHGQYRLCDIRRWIDNPEMQTAFSFLEEHELIRSPQAYTTLTGSDIFN